MRGGSVEAVAVLVVLVETSVLASWIGGGLFVVEDSSVDVTVVEVVEVSSVVEELSVVVMVLVVTSWRPVVVVAGMVADTS